MELLTDTLEFRRCSVVAAVVETISDSLDIEHVKHVKTCCDSCRIYTL